MTGSKYPDEVREQALALCATRGMTPKKVAEKLCLPPSTVYDWCNKADKSDPEFVYQRRKKKKQIVDRAMKIVDAGVAAIERQVVDAGRQRRQLHLLAAKAEDDPFLSDSERKAI
ncbi:MAG: helix-turn-helix domain-containing protein, partial [Sporomusa sp.]